MGFVAFAVLGLIAGAIAMLIRPAGNGGGWLLTLVLGVVGSCLGGWLGIALFSIDLHRFWDLRSWLCAIAGAAVVLLVQAALLRGRDRRP
ncbi:GlsB/YeaQ/YmgE family stress response membrane protein [Agromyces seonyuensis]|uniref:GlsB/YeaQ/YmgE family stress response membrane protein n=1 Tax=Agromyces seonyuensis TaxID=2662446 RepID=A0A6I4P4G0_9MICO|nr:GlsB/YeaQ/YmgE family stress response membrane protein [Agromyces seonyuensis]MWB98184.1 GlsB/YeaQ/YmgE family stress response membrane protein [Agromyces seonyuensis]